MPYFIDRVDGGAVQVFAHQGKTLLLGRGTNVEVRLDDPAVEMVHAAIEKEDEGYVLTDRGSALGTLVQGEPRTRHVLRSGDRIGIATFEISVELLPGDKPLFLHVARVGEDDASVATSVAMRSSSPELLQTFAETLVLRTQTMRGTPSLVAMAEAYAKAHDLPTEESGVADVRSHVPAAPPPEVPPLVPVDYAASYRLERGLWLRQSAAAAVLGLAVLGGLTALIASGVQDVFSPGDLAAVHKSVTANHCADCHRPFRRVGDQGCLAAGCHAVIGVHQESQVRDPGCLECHVEHSTLDALRQLDPTGGCVACHESLDAEVLGKTSFVTTITDFTAEKHPPFTPRTDPGNLRFSHSWHLNKLKLAGQTSLDCGSCHDRGAEGEIEPVSFEKHCQRCHNLAFDARYGEQEAEHDTPGRMLNAMTGFYLQNREVLRALTFEESDRLRGRGLQVEEQLAVVAQWNALALVRTKCRVCHGFDARPGRRPLKTLNVEPTELRFGWYDHAEFRHRPHLDLLRTRGGDAQVCDVCHVAARTSKEASDVLLAQVEPCLDCHRPPFPGEAAEASTLGRTTCIACHTYHPEPEERLAAAPSQE